MASSRRGARAGRGSGTAGGTDLEPLRGGMREQEKAKVGPEYEHAPDREPPEPAPERRGGRAPATEPRHGRTRREGTPPTPSGEEIERATGEKVHEVRADYENGAGNAPRQAAPGSSDERGRGSR